MSSKEMCLEAKCKDVREMVSDPQKIILVPNHHYLSMQQEK